ncbi:DUF3866 family protein [Jidongwangia harbinensis]|uniref:DUF3866 family protein n=1 Tax=Jidongwangia harbinensis TaxID=2878561 RepID=UPI001CDA1A8B|nr:DUF3866 family protein [Jidongwangia harbinensis]MCA2219446.1 DUF3866 family protein [Jidongwangia harbinensis]
MVRWRSGTVVAVRRRWHGAVELDVEVGADPVRALAYPELVGLPQAGDRVLLNVGALVMGLGTGGYALVVALPDRLPPDPPVDGTTRDTGHLVKARYTPLQPIRLGVDEEASPHRSVMAAAESLDGLPVVTADLHSALPAVLAGIHADRPGARVAYLMTDGGALPAWFSRTLDGLRDHLAGTVTTGQAFGGDLEASTVHTGLLAARHVLHADVAVVAQGPGNLGTGTAWGFSGVALGEAVNAIATLGGRPVGSLRISDGDGRPRHRGVSHHSLTAYGRVALRPADLVLPDPMPDALAAAVDAAVRPLGERHRLVRVPVDGLDEALRASPVGLSTMGRGLDADHTYFLAAAAAGRHAATLLGTA